MNALEKRRYKRFNTEGTVVLKPEDGISRRIVADLVDLNFCGIGISSKERIETGVNVKTELFSKLWDESIITEGIVKHTQETKEPYSNRFKIGIELTNFDEKAMKYLISRIQSDSSSWLWRQEVPYGMPK